MQNRKIIFLRKYKYVDNKTWKNFIKIITALSTFKQLSVCNCNFFAVPPVLIFYYDLTFKTFVLH